MVLTSEQIFKAIGRRVHQFKVWKYTFDTRQYMFQCIAAAKQQGYLPYEIDLNTLTVKLMKR